jgi:hypothetical protein
MRPRFSLRWLLILTALVAVACYWWTARPTILANRFRNRIAAQDFAAADRLCRDPNRRFVHRAVTEFKAGFSLTPFPTGSATTQSPVPVIVDVHVVRRTWNDLLRGHRRIRMAINFDLKEGAGVFVADYLVSPFGMYMGPRDVELKATPLAIHPPTEERWIFGEEWGRVKPPAP